MKRDKKFTRKEEEKYNEFLEKWEAKQSKIKQKPTMKTYKNLGDRL